ncbi:MAG: GPP34 family phosphoprotein [Mameliella sp.]|nr:GPP34 family phosphoprotein [Phaeodactylibacter sp.]
MELYLHESIVLISLDDEKGNFTNAGGYIYYAFGAALLMDLVLEGRIKLEEGQVQLKTNAITESRALNFLIERIQGSKKPKLAQNWIHDFVQKSTQLQKLAVEKLVQQGILEQTQGKVMWVFTVDRYPTRNAVPENELRNRLKTLMLDESATPDKKERMLLAIILKCELYNEVLQDKSQRKKAKARLAQLTEGSIMQEELGRAIEEMQFAILAATMAATAVT